MSDPTLIVSIDRTSLSLSPLVLSGTNDATELGVTGYVEPAIDWRIRYAPDSDYAHGSTALSAALQQTVLNFDAVTDQATTETAARALIAELRTALGQFAFAVTVTVGDAAPEVWSCNPGSVGAAARNYVDLRDHNAIYPVSIPCHPVRS